MILRFSLAQSKLHSHIIQHIIQWLPCQSLLCNYVYLVYQSGRCSALHSACSIIQLIKFMSEAAGNVGEEGKQLAKHAKSFFLQLVMANGPKS